MTAAPPNDSGAAASRDAARTARRLTDGTLPRRPPTPEPPEPAAPGAPGTPEGPPRPETPADPPPTSTVRASDDPEPAPSASAAPAATATAPDAPAPPSAAQEMAAQEAAAVPPGRTPPPTPAGARPAPPAPGAEAPAAPVPAPGVRTPAGPHAAPAASGVLPDQAPVPAAAGPAPTSAAHEAGAVARTAAVPPGQAPPPTPAGARPAPPAPGAEAPAAPVPAPGVRTPAGPHAAPAASGVPSHATPARTGMGPAPGASGAPAGAARTEAPAGPDPAQGPRPPAGPPATPGVPPGQAPAGAPAAAGPKAAVPSGQTPPAPSAAGAPAGPARTESPGTTGVPPSPTPGPEGPVSSSARTQAPTGPGSVPARAAAAAAAAAAARGPAGAAAAGTGVGVFKEERELLDFGRITGMRVASVAVPVAGVGRLPRRKNLIGAETTGSIPVHLLFRDGNGNGNGEGAGPGGAVGDDGGPDTVAMAPPASPKAKRTVIPRPATKHARPGPARPAPTADPALVERPAAVLPGWVGIAGGLLALVGCAAVVWWAGAVPAGAARMLGLPPRPYHGIHLAQWALLALGVLVLLFAVGGLGRGRVGYAWVLTLFGEYRGTVRRTGLVWASPLLLRRRVDVRLRHWRSEPLPAVDAKGTALDVTVLVVWRVRDTVRAALGVDGHEDYLREQVEAAMARVLSQLPADAFHEDAPTLRDAEAVGEALTRMLSAECAPVGLDVFSAQPTRIEYAPEVAEAMRRRRIAAIDAKHRDSVLTSVVDAVDDVVHRLTSRGLVELDDYDRKALVKDLTVAFYTGRGGPGEGA
ncbi:MULTISPECIES: SPFH domain-containing protein [unclassified Streptomyces]|uniref:SPFH domain-containing protein n=1 Tax=unclassified Streptomyces TaxID=2593676 RepID=UPI001F107149|nr:MULTISPECIES: SPFH domain-containing protein [unclassified Streptomyces]